MHYEMDEEGEQIKMIDDTSKTPGRMMTGTLLVRKDRILAEGQRFNWIVKYRGIAYDGKKWKFL